MEGKYNPTKGPYAESRFEREFESKITALEVRITDTLWAYIRDVIIYSGSGYVPPVVQLKIWDCF